MSTPLPQRTGERALTVRRRLAGVALLLIPALLMWLSLAVYNKEFTDDSTVLVRTGSVGNEMHRNADVKLHGVVIGEVREIASDGDGALLTLAVQPDKLGRVPADVSAQLLPTTLFGARFVALVPPEDPSPRALAAGSTIPQDRSENAVELQQVLDTVLPLLQAVKPAELSRTLSAASQALEGRGTRLGDTAVGLGAYLKELNPHLPALNRDIEELVEVSRAYGDAAPGIVEALSDFTTTSRTIAGQQADLLTLYGSTAVSAQDLTTFLRQNEDNIIRLSATARPTLELLAEYAPSFPCTLSTLADFVPAMDKALGAGTGEPGLHVDVKAVPPLGRYVPGRDAPVYNAGGGPRCYPVPYVGGPAGAAPHAAPGAASTVTGTRGGLGLPNSPQENRLVNELLALETEKQPQALPDWSSLLAGPVFRGAEVELK